MCIMPVYITEPHIILYLIVPKPILVNIYEKGDEGECKGVHGLANESSQKVSVGEKRCEMMENKGTIK